MISRLIKIEETAGLQAIEYGTTPFVLATAKSGINDLSLGQIADLYSGKQTKWADGQSVRLVLRPASDGDNAPLGGLSPAVKSALAIAMAREGMAIGITDQDTVDTIERLPGAIGTASLAVLKSENRRAVALAIDGVAPTVANLSKGSYPYHKRMYLVVKGAPGAAVSKFVAFVGSEAGRRILGDSGHAVAHEQAVAGKPAIKAGP